MGAPSQGWRVVFGGCECVHLPGSVSGLSSRFRNGCVWYASTGHNGRPWVGDGGRKTEDRGPESGKDLGLWVVPLLGSQTGQDAPGRTWLSGNAGGPGVPQSAVWTASSFPKEVQECHLPQLQHMQGLTLNAMGVNLEPMGTGRGPRAGAVTHRKNHHVATNNHVFSIIFSRTRIHSTELHRNVGHGAPCMKWPTRVRL